MKRTASYLLLGILMTVLTGCIEYREEIWLNKDDSGWLTFQIGLPLHTGIEESEITQLSIVSQCDSVEGMSVIATGTREVDGVTWIKADVAFDHILLLNEVRNKWFGHISLEDEEGMRRFKRVISMSDTINVNSNRFGKALKYAALGQYAWVYITHFPDDIHGSNATLIQTDTLTNTVTWEYSLASLINDEKIMSVDYRYQPGFFERAKNIFKRKN
ncbi:MAG: hypothetical protein K0B52_06755 [FCB group bacterium]|nr:hypothetical protein [FCB group bacterium]